MDCRTATSVLASCASVPACVLALGASSMPRLCLQCADACPSCLVLRPQVVDAARLAGVEDVGVVSSADALLATYRNKHPATDFAPGTVTQVPITSYMRHGSHSNPPPSTEIDEMYSNPRADRVLRPAAPSPFDCVKMNNAALTKSQ